MSDVNQERDAPRRIRQYSPNVQQHYRELRRNMPPMESLLWSRLRNRQVSGVKFRRQHPIQTFVLDFYAPELRLAVELDGSVHESAEQQAKDEYRTAKLNELEIQVFRIANLDVGQNLDGVITSIEYEINRIRAL